jgi:hypothetical protein
MDNNEQAAEEAGDLSLDDIIEQLAELAETARRLSEGGGASGEEAASG